MIANIHISAANGLSALVCNRTDYSMFTLVTTIPTLDLNTRRPIFNTRACVR